MKPFTIIWDFDGTLLPSDPYDSEHTLLLYNIHASDDRLSLAKRIVGLTIIFLDRKKWMGPAFKRYYAWVLSGTRMNRLDGVSEMLAQKISASDRASLLNLYHRGHTQMIISCGTLDLIERILEIAGIKSCFKRIEGNRFLSANDRIIGIQNRIIHPTDKLKPLKGQDLDADRVIAIGDGYTDLPLLDWAHFPVLMDRSQTKSRLPAERCYSKIASISDLVEWIEHLSSENGPAICRQRRK